MFGSGFFSILLELAISAQTIACAHVADGLSAIALATPTGPNNWTVSSTGVVPGAPAGTIARIAMQGDRIAAGFPGAPAPAGNVGRVILLTLDESIFAAGFEVE